jgi:hypothetical protein
MFVNTKGLKLGPTVQQGGTQTIQQAIYSVHNNPCGLNTLIFEEMGKTKIRYIDLKNYLDFILRTEESTNQWNNVREYATIYMDAHSLDAEKAYQYELIKWAQVCMSNLPVPVNNYPGYRFYFSVYDQSGAMIWDSKWPYLQPVFEYNGELFLTRLGLILPNPTPFESQQLYQLCNNTALLAWVDMYDDFNRMAAFSSFSSNQMLLPESIMAIASLLVDSANTRTFGIPHYGFSARVSDDSVGSYGYYCSHTIDVLSISDTGKTTLITSVMARLGLEENFIFGVGLSLKDDVPLYSTDPTEVEAQKHYKQSVVSSSYSNHLESNKETILQDSSPQC